MNKMKYLFIYIFIFAFFILQKANSQNNTSWQPIYLLVTGGNVMDGVEASFQVNKCNGKDIVNIKFINHTSSQLSLEWFDAVFTKELKWINKDKKEDKKYISLSPNAEIVGNCLNGKYPELTINMKDFMEDKNNFNRYSSSQLKIIKVK